MWFTIRTGIILLFFFAPILGAGQQQSLVYELRFNRNKHTLADQHKQLLMQVYESLVGKTNYLIFVNGHADSDADSSYNQQLSFKRSIAVKTFLVEKGIADSLFRVQALGEEQPLVANTTPMEKARNRRVELVVLFQQDPQVEEVQPKQDTTAAGCSGDTTVSLDGGYTLTLSMCDWERNSACLRIEKTLHYKFKVKENWLKKRIGFKDHKRFISYEPHYEFYVVSCQDSCFKRPVKLYIPQYQAPSLKTGVRFSQKKNNKSNATGLTFKKTKIGDSAYHVANIYCPGILNCSTDNRCTHPVTLVAKNNISILSYSYYVRGRFTCADTLVEVRPLTSKRLTDNYRHAFFHTLTVLYKGDTITLKNIPIDILAHGSRKVKTKGSAYDKEYFLFIPKRKKYSCGHYRKYKIKARDIEKLKEFSIE